MTRRFLGTLLGAWLAASAAGCGGSASETPFPLEPPPRRQQVDDEEEPAEQTDAPEESPEAGAAEARDDQKLSR